ncbi:hypothetical protein FRC10_001997 [Ceratobasidium sp. 414]|nr:hypothetical protein FRC10_001997 [Ceratobasidium sp. 414]
MVQGVLPRKLNLTVFLYINTWILPSGSYVINHITGEKFFEGMPIYVRIGMHLLFNQSYIPQTLLGEKRIDKLLKDQSLKCKSLSGHYENPHIQSFVETYETDTSQLLQPDVKAYKAVQTFNELFTRRLKPGARPITASEDPSVITSPADCASLSGTMLLLHQNLVKGKHFAIPELLRDAALSESKFGTNPSLAIFRLAPADYHRFHNPCNGVFGAPVSKRRKYYTVDVFTANRLDIRILESDISSASGLTVPVAIVAIGAMLVGSVNWSNLAEGTKVVKGEGIGWFQYRGSIVIAVFPGEQVEWDDDLVAASEEEAEVLVRTGQKIDRAIGAAV